MCPHDYESFHFDKELTKSKYIHTAYKTSQAFDTTLKAQSYVSLEGAGPKWKFDLNLIY